MGKDNNTVAWLLGAVLLMLFFSYLRWPYLEMPLDRDEGTYLVIGKQVAEGQLPYSGVYEMKPPGLFYTYAVLAAVGAYDFEGARGYTLIIYGLNGFLLFLLLRRRDWQWGALAAQMAFYAVSMDPYLHGYALLSEPLMILSFLTGLLILTYSRQHLMYALAGGLLIGWSVWIKQNMVFPLFFLGFWACYRIWVSHDLSRRRVAYAIVGALLGPLLTTVWIVLQSGGSDMMYWIWTYPAQVYTQSISWTEGMEYLKTFMSYSAPHTALWTVLALMGFGAHFFLKVGAWGRATPLLFFVFSFLAVSPGLRFYGHYWILLLPALALGVGALWEFLDVQLKRFLSDRPAKLVFLAFTLSVCGYHVYDQREVYIQPDVERWSRLSYGNNPFWEIRDIAAKLREYGRPDAKVAVMGSEPQLYVYLNQVPFTTHTFVTFLNKRHPRRGAMRSEFTSDVQRVQPKYIVFVNHPYSWSIAEGDHRDVHAWAYRYSKNNYKPIGLYEMDGTARDARIWSDKSAQLQPKASRFIQVYIRK